MKLDKKLSSETDEIFEHIDDQVDTMEKIIRRTDKKVDKHEVRIKDVEGEVESRDGRNSMALGVDDWLGLVIRVTVTLPTCSNEEQGNW